MASTDVGNAIKLVAGEVPFVVGRTVWANLPLLLVIDVCVALAAAPGVLAFLSGELALAALLAGVALGPVWAAAIFVLDRAVFGEDVSPRHFVDALRQHWLAGAKVGLVLGAVAAATVGTLTLWRGHPEQSWLVAPLFVDGSVLALLAVACLSVFTLATTQGVRGWALWLSALQVAARSPLLTAGAVALVVLLLLAVGWVPALALAIPGPFAVFAAAYAGLNTTHT